MCVCVVYDLVPLSVPLRRCVSVCMGFFDHILLKFVGIRYENADMQKIYTSPDDSVDIRFIRALLDPVLYCPAQARSLSVSFAPILDACGSHATVANADVHFINSTFFLFLIFFNRYYNC